MGTRSLTNVVDEKGDVYVSLYRQYDGYPTSDGHGGEIANWLEGAEIGNGINGSQGPKFFNGVGDLALRLVTYFRQDHKQIGSFYIIPPGTDWGPDFTYIVRAAVGHPVELTLKGYNGGTLFQGSVKEFVDWMDSDKKDD